MRPSVASGGPSGPTNASEAPRPAEREPPRQRRVARSCVCTPATRRIAAGCGQRARQTKRGRTRRRARYVVGVVMPLAGRRLHAVSSSTSKLTSIPSVAPSSMPEVKP